MNSFHPGAATYWTAADSVDTDLSFFRFLELYRTDVPERGMPPLGVVEALDVVERLMKRLGLQGVRRGKVVRTTISGMLAPCQLDRVNRQFKADRPNQLWVSDFTYVST